MVLFRYLSVLLLFCVGLGRSQQSGWVDDQVNATMCQWQSLRAAVIRDAVYIDGGYLFWLPGLKDGSYGAPTQDGNPRGLVFVLNFSMPFNTSQNMSEVFTTIAGADGAANNIHPLYYDGAMFANDGEYFTYGGLFLETTGLASPAANAVQGYEAYWYGAPRSFTPGFVDANLPDGVTRYVTYGAGVSVPSENKGFYFSGLKSPDSGPIYFGTPNASKTANTTSNTLISVDLSQERNEAWANQSLPAAVPGRASAELAWVPVGKNGVLVAIGGVLDPEYAQVSQSLTDAQSAQDQATDPGFMTTVSIYDVESGTWFSQETSGSPPPGLAQGCTVVASAQDYSSHNIYWYGGFAGIDSSQPFSDDVYVLSVPSFTWTKVYNGSNTHGRASHKCFKPYPDQMFVIGGYTPFSSGSVTCLESNVVQVFNLSSATWMTSYDPAIWSNYSVPALVVKAVGGTGSGGATQLGPSSTDTWSNKTLQGIFGTKYDTSKINNWYPYSPSPTNTTSPAVTSTPTPSPSSSGLPSWLAPVLGTVLGLVAVSAILVCVLVWRRRRYFQRNGTLTETSDMNRHRILSWVRGAGGGGGGKAPTVTTDDMASSPTEELDSTVEGSGNGPVEAASREVHELMDTSRPQELLDTGMRYLPAAGATALRPSPSDASHNSHLSQSSLISGVSGSSLGQGTSLHTPRPDSPSLGSAQGSRIVSGITEISSRHSFHLRQLSLDSEVSDTSGPAGPTGLGIGRLEESARNSARNSTDQEQQIPVIVTSGGGDLSGLDDRLFSPVSPPTPGPSEGSDYLTGRPSAATGSGLVPVADDDRERAKVKRRSNFGEILDE